MLATSRVRELLGATAKDLSDAELTELARGMYVLARHALGEYRRGHRIPASQEASALAAVPELEREAIEERAAVLEFDAKMPRDTATRLALHDYAKRRSVQRPS